MENQKDKLLQYAYFLINKRLYSVYEFSQKIINYSKSRGIKKEIGESIIRSFVEDGFLDDEKYAEAFILDALDFKSYGPYMIKMKLSAKKIPSEIIDKKMSELVSKDKILKLAREISAKKLADYKRNTKKTEIEIKASLQRYLAGRGFSFDVIRDVLSDLPLADE